MKDVGRGTEIVLSKCEQERKKEKQSQWRKYEPGTELSKTMSATVRPCSSLSLVRKLGKTKLSAHQCTQNFLLSDRMKLALWRLATSTKGTTDRAGLCSALSES